MKKIILVDGNNLLFRSYYATAYSGNFMRNKDGFPTNGIYGLVNMINKIISEEKPTYMAVAFDVGKTFRHEEYADYKGGRSETPDDLKKQFPIAKKIIEAMGIKSLECPGYEADDIIGTLATKAEEDPDFEAVIISSDKDLLQLVSDETEVKLLKQKDYIRMDKETFKKIYGIEPINMTDLKGLMGDSSDNIKGVRGIGEKTALKLLQKYNTIENLYEHIDEISGATKVKLLEDKDSAFESKHLATIIRNAPLNIELEDIKYGEEHTEDLINLYNDLGFYSFLKKMEAPKKSNELDIVIASSSNDLKINTKSALYIELDGDNYHNANIIGLGVYNEELSLFIPYDILKENNSFLTKFEFITYDYKRLFVSLNKFNININDIKFDTMIAGYLLNYNIKDDIAYLAKELDYEIPFKDKKDNLNLEEMAKRCIMKAKFIYETESLLSKKLIEEEVNDLFKNIEMPLCKVLGRMEIAGIRVDKNVLEDMGKDIDIKLELISQNIYNLAGTTFNIASPKQLGEILFEKLHLPHGKKNKKGYSTDVNVLNKLKDYPIVSLILEHRSLSKLKSTYIDGIISTIASDGKIHTIYTQTLTRTGRLSSIEPNLQNIPARSEYGRLIRKAFIPEENSLIMSSDYSQIELRMFAHLSQVKELIDAFNKDMDIHTKTAMDIFMVPIEGVTKEMRRHAKAVNFGILYGISSFGLSEDLGISPTKAKKFINAYFETYPGIKEYMNEVIKKAHELGYVKTIMNRKRIIEELKNPNYIIRSMGERMALNTPVQGSSADILKKAMIEIDREFERLNLKSKMLLQVHDELIFNCLIDEKETVKNVVTNIMENTYKISVPLKVDVEFGKNWYEAK